MLYVALGRMKAQINSDIDTTGSRTLEKFREEPGDLRSLESFRYRIRDLSQYREVRSPGTLAWWMATWPDFWRRCRVNLGGILHIVMRLQYTVSTEDIPVRSDGSALPGPIQ